MDLLKFDYYNVYKIVYTHGIKYSEILECFVVIPQHFVKLNVSIIKYFCRY